MRLPNSTSARPPAGSWAPSPGHRRDSARILRGGPNVVQVVPLTRTIRISSTEVLIDPDEDNRLVARSSAQCQHMRSVTTTRIHERTGNVGRVVLNELRETQALLLDL